MDAETGLYYYGARYYDARTSRWISTDPILEEYFPTGDKEKDKQLPGMGGAFNPVNLNLYHYAGNSPIVMIDPDGKKLYNVVIRGGGPNVFGHSLVLHVDNKTNVATYYEVTGPNTDNVNVHVRNLEEFRNHYNDRDISGLDNANFNVTQSTDGYDVVEVKGVNEKDVLDHLKDMVAQFGINSNLYPYKAIENNCAAFCYEAYQSGGLEPKSDPSDIGEKPKVCPRDLNQAIRYQNNNRDELIKYVRQQGVSADK